MTQDRSAVLAALSRARTESDHHRALAEDLELQASATGDSQQRKQLRSQAHEAFQLASHFEEEAARHLEEWRSSQPSRERGAEKKTEAELTEDEDSKLRRAWFLPGSVADDPMLQLDEAGTGGLLEQTARYAGRSILDLPEHGIHPDSIVGKVTTALKEGLRPIGVLDHLDRQAEGQPRADGSVFERLAQAEPPAGEAATNRQPDNAPAGVDPSDGSLFQWLTKQDADPSRPTGPLFDPSGSRSRPTAINRKLFATAVGQRASL